MNYEQARQIGPDGLAPGKWNWTNSNDSIAAHPYTARPCSQPLAGGERCDHDTQEEAERHHHDWELQRAQFDLIDLATVRQRNRCDFPACPNWATFTIRWPNNTWLRDELCDEHADDPTVLHPFVPGARTIHS